MPLLIVSEGTSGEQSSTHGVRPIRQACQHADSSCVISFNDPEVRLELHVFGFNGTKGYID